jgi:hypothetical protein
VGGETIAIALNRAAQRQQFRRHRMTGGGDVTQRSQTVETRRGIRHRSRDMIGRPEQDLLARRLDAIAGKIVNAGERRYGGRASE